VTRRDIVAGALLAPLTVALTGCGGGASATEPPQINFGRDTCDACGMIISDERFAAGLVAADGAASTFDDVGEMLQAVREQGLGERQAWVHDLHSREWIDATTAIYVRAAPETTPMATGFVAFGRQEDAATYAAERDGEILTWTEATSA
jgi:copper chaperone NosL